ncbi:MAG: SpoIIE family protein phosphatase [Candidatus Tumulicola sp.]
MSIFQQLQHALDSDDAFAAVADAMPQLVWTSDADGTIDYFNRRWIGYTGVTLSELPDRGPVPEIVHPDELDETWFRWNASISERVPFEIEHRLRGADGNYRWFLTRAEPLRNADGQVVRWVGTATEVDQQRRLRDSLTLIVETSNIFLSSLDERAICHALADVAIGNFADWCFVWLIETGGVRTAAIAHKDVALLRCVERLRLRDLAGAALSRVLAEGSPLLVERIVPERFARDAWEPAHAQLLQTLRLHSAMVVPIVTPAGAILGALGVASAESGHEFNPGDLDVASAVAARTAVAIENVRILASERTTSQRLRFTGRVNEMLLDSRDLWSTMKAVATAIAEDLADACAVIKLEGDAIRVEAAAARNPIAAAAMAALEGQRPLRPEVERRLARRLRERRSVVHDPDSPQRMKLRTWPYLADHIEALRVRSTVIVPLHSADATYGALTVMFSEHSYEPLRDLPAIEDVAARASVAVERAETFERERNIASTLQKASLPTIIPKSKGLQFDAVYLPAGQQAEVGGDWYDALEFDDGSVVISVGDVTGRGIQATAIMSKVRHAMGMVPLHEVDPAKILDAAEWFLRKRYPEAIVTAFVATVNPERTSMQFANAGHLPPFLRRHGQLLALEDAGLPLGLRYMETGAESRSIELHEADLLVLFTDGLVEWNRNWDEGERAIERVLSSRAVVATGAPAKLIARSCLPARPYDDVAILAVRVGHAPVWSFVADDVRAAVDARRSFVAFLRRSPCEAHMVARAEVVFGELLGSVVRHAPGPVEIQLYCNDATWKLHVIDSGDDFEASGTLPSDILSELGRGLYIVRQLAKRVRVEHVANCGNHIAVEL